MNKIISEIIIIFLLFLTGCSGRPGTIGTLKGTVVDTNFNPISGANILCGSKATTTYSDGTYTISSVSQGSKILIILKGGFTTSYRRVNAKAGETVYVPIAILAPLDSKTTQIGGGGGIVTNTDGSIKLDIPSGALSETKNISITKVILSAAPYPPPIGYQFIAVIVYATPIDTVLSTPEVLSIPNITNLATGTSVPFYYFNTNTLEWELISDAGGTASLDTNTITAHIRLFGWLAAILPISPSAGNLTGTVTDSGAGLPIGYANVWVSSFATVANSSGIYTLSNLPTGEVTVEALATGYMRGTSTCAIAPGSTTTCNINLTPIFPGTVSGKVYNAGTSAGISGARVVLNSQAETITDSLGDYTFNNVSPGYIEVRAYANGYYSNSVGDNLTPGGSLTLNISLIYSGSSPQEWTDDFETDKGWSSQVFTTKVIWQRKGNTPVVIDSLASTYVTLPDAGNIPSAHLGNYCYWYGESPGQTWEGCYIGEQSPTDEANSGGTSSVYCSLNWGKLTSPTIDIRNWAYASLSFWTWWEIESFNARGYDKMVIQVSTDNGTTWKDIGILNPIEDPDSASKRAYLPYSSGGFNEAGLWVKHTFGLNSYVGNQIKIRFYFDTVDAKYNGFRGWLIDDIALSPTQVQGESLSSSSVERRPDKGNLQTLPR